MLICPQCHRHIRETHCPFCGTETRAAPRSPGPPAIRVGMKRSAMLIGLVAATGSAAGCGGVVATTGDSAMTNNDAAVVDRATVTTDASASDSATTNNDATAVDATTVTTDASASDSPLDNDVADSSSSGPRYCCDPVPQPDAGCLPWLAAYGIPPGCVDF
jgi:hypothetical protein